MTARRVVAVALLAGAAIVVVQAIADARRSRLRDFDPVTVAHAETRMWRAYYARKKAPLYTEMVSLLETQYHLSPVRARIAAYRAAHAAFVFQRGSTRAEYEKALPDLRAYYDAIRKASDTAFDAQRAARLELEWWIIHRERARHPPADLARALGALQAELYHVPARTVWTHAEARARAMTIRDRGASRRGVSERDWARIDSLLVVSWTALHDAVN